MDVAHIRPDNLRNALKYMQLRDLYALIAMAETGSHALPPGPGGYTKARRW